MTIIRLAAIGGTALMLAACGGSSSEPNAFEQNLAEAEALFDRYEGRIDDEDYTRDIPADDSATYDGSFAVVLDRSSTDLDVADADAIGDIRLVADFAANRITGTVDDIANSDGEELGGSLAVRMTLDRSKNPTEEFTMVGDIRGTLTTEEGDAVVAGRSFADFFGDDAEFIAGGADGTVTTEAGVSTFEAGFIAD